MQDIGAALSRLWEHITTYAHLPQAIAVTDIIEIAIIAILFYYMLVWIKNTKAWTLLKGILVILLFIMLAAIFQMNTIIWIAEKMVSVAVIAIAVIFQPEMRKALESLGRHRLLMRLFNYEGNKTVGKFSDKTITELVRACFEMGKVKTGALIVVEDEMMLTEYERTGIAVDGIVSSQLLINIFEKNTPLHDGAVIVRGDRVVSATCYLPLSDSLTLSKDLGTRHRAAVGISEVSDSMTIVVSEETGKVSIALGGELYRNVDADFLKNKLMFLQKREAEVTVLDLVKRRLKDVKGTRREISE